MSFRGACDSQFETPTMVHFGIPLQEDKSGDDIRTVRFNDQRHGTLDEVGNADTKNIRAHTSTTCFHHSSAPPSAPLSNNIFITVIRVLVPGISSEDSTVTCSPATSCHTG